MRSILLVLGALAAGGARTGAIRDAAGASSPDATEGGGAGLLASLGPILLIAVLIAIVIAVVAAVILFRTRGVTEPTSAEGWWTCPKCGASNMDASARCHACSTWRSTSPSATPSASP